MDELICALLCEFNVDLFIVVPFPTPSGAFEGWNVGKYFFFRVPILMGSDGGGLMDCNRALLYEFNIKLFTVIPFQTPSEALRVGTYVEKYFFFRVPILMASDGCGLVELLCTLPCIFRIRVRCDDVLQ